jgi:UDP-glucose 6-dehydrogenase
MSRNILGGEPEYVDQVDALYKHRFGNSLLTFKTSWEAAELSKYGANMFFAVKLSFFNYIYSVCENLGLDYDQVRDMVVSDARLGRSHDKIPGADSKLGWGNFCFPKDLAAFINYSKDLGMNPELLEATWNQNLRDRGERDWEQLPGVVSKRKKDGQT